MALLVLLSLFDSRSPASLSASENGIILGRIEVRNNDSRDAGGGGPVKLLGDAAAIFHTYLAREQIDIDNLSGSDVSDILANHHLVLSSTERPALTMPAQWERLPRDRSSGTSLQGNLVWMLPDDSNRPIDGQYTLSLQDGPPTSEFTVEDLQEGRPIVKYANKRVLRYNCQVVQQRADRAGLYDRACYIHPVWAPSGEIVTGDFSPEHIHQRGIFTAWVKARFGNVETDFWGLGASKGRILPSGTPPQAIIGPVFTKLIISNQGVVEESAVFNERVEVTVYSGINEGGWLFDLRTMQGPVPGGDPMELLQVYYGGTSFRGPATWLARTSGDVKRAMARGVSFQGAKWLKPGVELDILTSDGNDRTGGDRTTPQWIDFSGPLGNGWGGLAMYDHPSNLRYPTPIRIHPELPYFSFAFVQNAPFTIVPGKRLELLYRARVHDGHPESQANARVAAAFRAPPTPIWHPLK